MAQNAWHLRLSGYRTLALDFVPRTLIEVQRRIPDVRPLRGDVRALPFPDDALDAYWSIGVIEHWYDGYREARDEMARVLGPGDHLFLTFPYMSPLRKLRARLGTYPSWEAHPSNLEAFYQFALDHREVTKEFERVGFELIRKKPFLGVSGLEEELPPRLSRLVKRTQGAGLFRRALRTFLGIVCAPWTSHCILLVLRKDAS